MNLLSFQLGAARSHLPLPTARGLPARGGRGLAIYFPPSALGGGPYRRFFDRKLSGKNTNSRQIQITRAGTMVKIKLMRSNRRCMKYATISAALMIDAPIRITSM